MSTTTETTHREWVPFNRHLCRHPLLWDLHEETTHQPVCIVAPHPDQPDLHHYIHAGEWLLAEAIRRLRANERSRIDLDILERLQHGDIWALPTQNGTKR